VNNLFTIGYEKANLPDFIKTLKDNGINILLDIREFPISRNQGFSKKQLALALEESGIHYLHKKALGSPKKIRDALHSSGDYSLFFRQFEDYLLTCKPLLHELTETIQGSVVLMCYERDYKTCHRLIVAQHIHAISGAVPTHLLVKKYAKDYAKAVRLGEGLPAT
jgi:uncharacterized protein (DUF488 family)